MIEKLTLIYKKDYKIFLHAIRKIIKKYPGDVLHDAFIIAQMAIKRGKYTEDNMHGWFYTICVNSAINHYRKRNKPSTINYVKLTRYDDVAIENNIENDIINDELWKILDRLPDKEKKILLLKYREGLKFEDVSKEMGVNINTIRVASRRAIFKLRKLIRA